MARLPHNPHIEALQAALGIEPRDGIRGPQTTMIVLAAADAGRLSVPKPVAKPPEVRPIINPPAEDDIPPTGDARLVGVHDALAEIIRETSRRCPVPFTVIEGLRTPERQRQLVAAGASKTQNSRHLTGHAADLWPLDANTGKPLPSDAAFRAGSAQAKAASARLWEDLRAIAAVAKLVAKERGVMLEWGGDWGWDAHHFQLNRQAFPA